MSINNLTTDKLRLEVERLLIKNIKLCQDNFLYFVKEMWPDFIYRKTKLRDNWGHHQIIANEFTKVASDKKGRLNLFSSMDDREVSQNENYASIT